MKLEEQRGNESPQGEETADMKLYFGSARDHSHYLDDRRAAGVYRLDYVEP